MIDYWPASCLSCRAASGDSSKGPRHYYMVAAVLQLSWQLTRHRHPLAPQRQQAARAVACRWALPSKSPCPSPSPSAVPMSGTSGFVALSGIRVASGLVGRDEEVQVNTLFYAMGDQADDILRSFALSEEQRKSYMTVKSKFDDHFIQRRNVVFERAKFNRRRQEEGESVESFITALYALAEHCGYGNLHNEMIRDRIVVGI